jgi:DNA-binding NtrC family response regulator
MKPIWIVDDDQSIRFVLEKALAREQFQVRSFANAREVLGALADDARRRCWSATSACPGAPGWTCWPR